MEDEIATLRRKKKIIYYNEWIGQGDKCLYFKHKMSNLWKNFIFGEKFVVVAATYMIDRSYFLLCGFWTFLEFPHIWFHVLNEIDIYYVWSLFSWICFVSYYLWRLKTIFSKPKFYIMMLLLSVNGLYVPVHKEVIILL